MKRKENQRLQKNRGKDQRVKQRIIFSCCSGTFRCQELRALRTSPRTHGSPVCLHGSSSRPRTGVLPPPHQEAWFSVPRTDCPVLAFSMYFGPHGSQITACQRKREPSKPRSYAHFTLHRPAATRWSSGGQEDWGLPGDHQAPWVKNPGLSARQSGFPILPHLSIHFLTFVSSLCYLCPSPSKPTHCLGFYFTTKILHLRNQRKCHSQRAFFFSFRYKPLN